MIIRKPELKDQHDLFLFLNGDKKLCDESGLYYTNDYDSYSINSLIYHSTLKDHYYYVIEIDNRAVGLICSNFDNNEIELSFAIGKKYQNKGYMYEALSKVIQLIPYNCICEVYKNNHRCIHLLHKLGFIQIDKTKDTVWLRLKK